MLPYLSRWGNRRDNSSRASPLYPGGGVRQNGWENTGGSSKGRAGTGRGGVCADVRFHPELVLAASTHPLALTQTTLFNFIPVSISPRRPLSFSLSPLGSVEDDDPAARLSGTIASLVWLNGDPLTVTRPTTWLWVVYADTS